MNLTLAILALAFLGIGFLVAALIAARGKIAFVSDLKDQEAERGKLQEGTLEKVRSENQVLASDAAVLREKLQAAEIEIKK